MKVLDANFVISSFNGKVKFSEDYFVAPDVVVELGVDPNIGLQSNIRNGRESTFFDEVSYLKNYYIFVNKYTPSFYNMTNLGDISTIAFIKTVLDKIKRQPGLPTMSETLMLYSDDKRLNKRCKKEFGDDVEIVTFSDIVL